LIPSALQPEQFAAFAPLQTLNRVAFGLCSHDNHASQCCILLCRPEFAGDVIQQYSDDSGSEEEEEDEISMCSGSTVSAGGQSCSVSDLFSSALDDAYSDGTHTLTFPVVMLHVLRCC